MRVEFGDYIFDSQLHLLTRKNEVVELTPKAFSLLESLIEVRPAPVTKEVLYDRLWPATFVEPGNLHNLISEIRAALEDEDHSIIRTVRGVGYAFHAAAKMARAVRFAVVAGNEVFPLHPGENIVGRGLDATVIIDSPDVSRAHARLTVSGGEVSIEDMGSRNGTFIGTERITSKRPVRPGDSILLGRFPIVLREVATATTATL